MVLNRGMTFLAPVLGVKLLPQGNKGIMSTEKKNSKILSQLRSIQIKERKKRKVKNFKFID